MPDLLEVILANCFPRLRNSLMVTLHAVTMCVQLAFIFSLVQGHNRNHNFYLLACNIVSK